MGIFQEYMNSKGSVEKSKVSVTGDFVDPMTSPNAPKGGKPYVVSDGRKLKKYKEKGFGDEGDSKLKYIPKVDKSNGAAAAKIPTAEQAELCSVLIDAIKKDPTIAEQLIFQLRHNGQMGMIVAEMLQFKETYQHIAEVMSHRDYGNSVCRKLVRAMNEEVAPPFAASLEGEEDEDQEDLEGEEMDPDMQDPDMQDPDMAPPMQDPNMAPQDPNMQDPNMQDPNMQDPNMQDPNMAPPMQDPNMQDPNMAPQDPNMAPPMPMPPPRASAMKNFQMAMMGKR